MSEYTFNAERDYEIAIYCFRQMLKIGTITKEEFAKIDTIFLEKYRPVFGTLFSDLALTSGEDRVIYSGEKEGFYA